MTGHPRLQWIKNTVASYVRGADLVVMEGPAYGAKGRAVHQLAGIWWILAHKMWREGVPYAVVDPKTLKIYATDNGKASKQMVNDAISEVHPTLTFVTDDESDAYTLLTMAHHHYNVPMLCCGGQHHYPGHSRVTLALGHVEWPEII